MTTESFGSHLRILRRNARDQENGGSLSQSRLADLLSAEVGIVYSRAAISDWERGKGQIHKDARHVLVSLIKVLHSAGGLLECVEANQWLTIGNYRALDSEEIAKIDAVWLDQETQFKEGTPVPPSAIFMPPMLPMHPIIGRTELLVRLKDLLYDGRSLALSAINGLPGIGKTALALLVAHDAEIRDRFVDGVLWVGLGTNPDIFALLGRWAEAVGISPDEMSSLGAIRLRADAIHEAILDKRMLLVIDDVWESDHALPFKLGGGQCAHILTSRYPPVAASFAGPHALPVQELSVEQGMELLRWLAPRVVDREPEAARALVKASGGLPLSLVLIGSELRMVGVAGSDRRLGAALDTLQEAEKRLMLQEPASLLQRESHPSLPRGTAVSLHAVIGISDARLSPAARAALRALALFPAKPNSFSEEAALSVANTSTDTLDLLVDHGLLESAQMDRYTLHQAIHDYARLEHVDDGARARMVAYYQQFVTAQDDQLHLENELENINAALQAADQGEKRAELWSLLDTLFPFFDDKGYYEPAQTFLKRLDMDDAAVDPVVKFYLGRIANRQGDTTAARTYWEAGLAAARKGQAYDITITLLSNLSMYAGQEGDYETASAYLEEAVTNARAAGNWEEVCRALGNIGRLAYLRDSYEEAETYLQEALSVAQTHDFPSLASGILNLLGIVTKARGQHAKALDYFRAGLAIAREHRYGARTSTLLVNIGQLLNEMGSYHEATAYLEEGLALARQLGDRGQESHLLMDLGVAAAGQDDFVAANRYLEAAYALAAELENKWLVAYTAVHWGTVALQAGDLVSAVPLLEEALALGPEVSPNALIRGLGGFGLAQISLAAGDRQKADRLSSTALAALEASDRGLTNEVRDWRLQQGFEQRPSV